MAQLATTTETPSFNGMTGQRTAVFEAQAALGTPELARVQATIDFAERFGRTDLSPTQTALLVREFLEEGGLRAEIQPVSQQKYSSVLVVPEEIYFKTGTVVTVNAGSQAHQETAVPVARGIYRFDYNTEHGLTLHNLNDPKDVVPLTLGGPPAGSLQINATLVEQNTAQLAAAINNTSAFYASDPRGAELIEHLTRALYAENSSGYQATLQIADVQSNAALAKVQGVISNILREIDPTERAQWIAEIQKMLDGATVLNDLHGVRKSREQIAISDELFLVGSHAEFRLGIDIAPQDGAGSTAGQKLLIYLYNPTHFVDAPINAQEKPLIMFQFGNLGERLVSSSNSQQQQHSWEGMFRLNHRDDFDNARVFGEAAVERALLGAVKDPQTAPMVWSVSISGGGLAERLIKALSSPQIDALDGFGR